MVFLENLSQLMDGVVKAMCANMGSVEAGVPGSEIHQPHDVSHGDLTSNVALKLTKRLGQKPILIAESIKALLEKNIDFMDLVASVAVVHPGFINFSLKPELKYETVKSVLREKSKYGMKAAKKSAVLLEFVSANPTGPLHIGHARQAVLGDAIFNLMKTQGHSVAKEFFYNDAGNQIQTLTDSVKLRLDGHKPGDECWPIDGNLYNGEYVADIAQSFLNKESIKSESANELIEVSASGDANDLENIQKFAVAYLRKEQATDLNAIGVEFDSIQLESDLYKNGDVERTVEKLIKSGYTKNEDGALWLKSTEFGDDKDRVMKKKEGGYTYFVPDVAYHKIKWDRGFEKAVNIQGTDHHGTIKRVRAGLQALGEGIPADFPSYLLHTMINVVKDGKPVKISKRAGSYVTLSDIVSWTSADAVKFFLLAKKASTEDTFDVDMAVKKNNENPVFYVQYAHARIKTMLTRWMSEGGSEEMLESIVKTANLNDISSELELKIITMLERYPSMLEISAKEMAPHAVVTYLRELATMYHQYYGQAKIFIDDENKKTARLIFSLAIAQVIKNGLSVLGVSAPESMAQIQDTE